MPPNLYAMSVVLNYLDRLDSISDSRGYSFEQWSYSKWAATEILRILESTTDIPPLITLEDFKDRMELHADKLMFLVAHDVAETIISMML